MLPPGFRPLQYRPQPRRTLIERLSLRYEEWLSGWGDLDRVPVAYVEEGDTVACSSASKEAEVGQVYRIRGGLVAEYVDCRSWEEAIRIGGIAR